jgi:DNA polymerase-1
VSDDRPTLMLVDGHSLAFRAFYALPLDNFVTPEGQHTNAIHGFLSMLLSLLKKEQPTHLAIAFDISRYSFRTKIYPDYKATRGDTPPEFVGQVPLLQEALDAMNIPTLQKEDYEADDIIATLAHQGSEAGFRVLVVSGDRDTFQLIDDNVTVLYPSARGVSELKRYDADAVMERYGIPPERYPDVAALVGETSDNLIGVDKVGEKTAVKWLTEYGDLDGVLAHKDDITGVVGQNLRDQYERAVLNRQLNHLLRDVDLPVTPADLTRQDIDAVRVKDVFQRLRFRTLTERVLALAGEDTDSSDPPAPAVSAHIPTAKYLLDEELAKWLSQQTLLRVVSDPDHPGVRIALASDHDIVIVEAGSGSPDLAPLGDWLMSDHTQVMTDDGKALLHRLGSPRVKAGCIAGDIRLTQWLINPSAKPQPLPHLINDRLGVSISAGDPNQLVPESSDTALAELAWYLGPLNESLRSDLPADSAAVLDDIDIPLIPVLQQMEATGIGSDREALTALEKRLAKEADDAQKKAFEAIGREVNLASPKQLQEVLFDQLGMPKTRATKTGYTTDAAALQDLQESSPHPFLDHLLAHRDVTKLRQIVEGLLKAIGTDGRLHTTFDQTGTSTGRLSSLEPNLQNIPVRTEQGREIRATFVSQDPYEGLLTADYSQIEMRIMAHFSGDQDLIRAFERGEDLHRFVGSQVFGVDPDDVTPLMRTKVKAMSYGLAYGLSAFGLAKQLRIPTDEAKTLMTDYFARFGKVRDYLRDVVEQAKKDGYTQTAFGRRRVFHDLASPNRVVREAAERAALNAPMQGTAADIIKRAMIGIAQRLTEDGFHSRMVLQVHDELIFEVWPGEREKLTDVVVHEMSSAATLSVPLDVQVGFGANWDDAAH